MLGPPNNAGQIHGRDILKNAPTNDQILRYNSSTKKWGPAGIPPFYDYLKLMVGGSMVPVTNPATVDQAETTTNKVNYVYGEFTDGGSESLQWAVDMPVDWNGDSPTLGKISAEFIWTALSGSGTVKFVLSGNIFADDSILDSALASIGNSIDTLLDVGDLHISPATTESLISAVDVNGKYVVFKVTRDSANDTLNATARLIGIRIKFIRTVA